MDSSNVNPLALLFMMGLGLVILFGHREWAVKSLLAIAAFIPLGQQIVVGGLNFTFLRILILVGCLRLLMRGETREFRWQTLDKLFLAWAVVGCVCGMLRSPSAEILGMLYNSVGVYFLVRCLTRHPSEVVGHLRFLVPVAVFIAVAMSVEAITHKNPFYILGGVPEFVGIRDGRLRCQGPFRHPILGGTFAATLFPLLVGLWFQGGWSGWRKGLLVLGIVGCVVSTYLAASSGALLTCMTAAAGMSLWVVRFHMHLVRRGIVLFIVALTIVMKPPPYYIISKLSGLFGGTGWHRSFLIDQAVRYVNEWWLIGSSYTAHWAPGGQVLAVDPNNMDITNHYIAQGLQGGMLRLGLFVAMITTCFKIIGRTLRREDDFPLSPMLVWAFGVCLACHCTAFISISYFDQIEVFLYWLFAAIATFSVSGQYGHVDPAEMEAEADLPETPAPGSNPSSAW